MGDREQFWQIHVDACPVSGETQTTYCERHGIAAKTFRKWRARLAGAARVIAADNEPLGGGVKGGAKELFSPSFDDSSAGAQSSSIPIRWRSDWRISRPTWPGPKPASRLGVGRAVQAEDGAAPVAAAAASAAHRGCPAGAARCVPGLRRRSH